jgi:hypothetical protein
MNLCSLDRLVTERQTPSGGAGRLFGKGLNRGLIGSVRHRVASPVTRLGARTRDFTSTIVCHLPLVGAVCPAIQGASNWPGVESKHSDPHRNGLQFSSGTRMDPLVTHRAPRRLNLRQNGRNRHQRHKIGNEGERQQRGGRGRGVPKCVYIRQMVRFALPGLPVSPIPVAGGRSCRSCCRGR